MESEDVSNEKPEFALRSRLHKIFLPDIRYVNDSGLLRERFDGVDVYREDLDSLVAAGALCGVAKRVGLAIVPYEVNGAEELDLRRALRGRTPESFAYQQGQMSFEEIIRDVEELGGSRDEIKIQAQRIREQVSQYLSKEPPKDKEKADKIPKPIKQVSDVGRVTKIDGLFKIWNEMPISRFLTYYKAHILGEKPSYSIVLWESPVKLEVGESETNCDLVDELKNISSPEDYYQFLRTLAVRALWIKMGDAMKDSDVQGLVSLIDAECAN